MAFKKSNLMSLFEEEDNATKTEDSTFLNSSTVPTYEEFTKKTSKNFLSNRFLNSTQGLSRLSIVTDDESDEETTEQFKSFAKNSLVDSWKKDSMKTPSKLDRLNCLTKSNILNTPKMTFVGTPTIVNSSLRTPKTATRTLNETNDEYCFYENKQIQTSFSSTEELDSQSDDGKIIEDSIIEIPKEVETNKEFLEENSNVKDNEFNLRLSSSSGAASSEADSKKNSMSPVRDLEELQIADVNVTQRKKNPHKVSVKSSTNSNKRVSICGQALNDDVFNIDDTVVDQFDNELDHKKGLIYSIIEINEENSIIELSQPSSLFSSTKLNVDQTKQSYRNSQKSCSSDEEEKGKVILKLFNLKKFLKFKISKNQNLGKNFNRLTIDKNFK